MRKNVAAISKYFLSALFLASVSFLPIYLYHQLDLKTVIVVGGRKLNGLSIFNDSNLLSIDINKIESLLQKQNPTLKTVRISKKFPNTAIVETTARIPIAQFKSKGTNVYIDEEGVIFANSEVEGNLAVINVLDLSVPFGQKVDWKVGKAISIIQLAHKQSINIEQIWIDDAASTFLIKLVDGSQVYLPYNADIQAKVSSLQLIVLRFRIEGKNIAKVDFRFDKPIVTLTTGEKISSTLPAQAGLEVR